jgi:hypothetical protein
VTGWFASFTSKREIDSVHKRHGGWHHPTAAGRRWQCLRRAASTATRPIGNADDGNFLKARGHRSLAIACRLATIEGMLAPQYTLRRLLAIVTLSAFVCLVVAAAIQGHLWAAAVALALAGLAVMMMVYGLLFILVRGIGALLDRRKQLPTPSE